MNYPLFISTFALIFVAELPDKTAFATLILATRNNPWAIFIGACGAFVVQSLVAVLFGHFISLLPHSVTQIGAGILFLIFAVLMWRKDEEGDEGEDKTSGTAEPGFWKPAVHSFMVIFIAEWGDLTQLATATLVANNNQPLTIFLSATLALWTVTGLAVLVGHKMKSKINPKWLQKIAAIAFVAVGIYMLVRALGH
jgi:Ca2+/H+ antiporter, TMEM165/GDT1 family